MVEEGKTLIEIDLNQFKLHIHIQDSMELSLHFNSPSRRFYLSVIALVVHEMKMRGNVASVPIEAHYDTLVLLNETIGGKAGSSDRENLLPRIYRKWKDALPDLEHAPLFTIPGRRKEYEDSVGKTYPFTDEEKDAWANLFEYKGSHENVRLRFSVGRLGATLDEVVITYGKEPNLSDEYSWDRFTGSLEQELYDPDSKDRVPVAPTPRKRSWWRPWPAVLGVVGLLLVGAALATWYFSFRTPKSISDGMFPIKSPLPLPDKPSIAVLPFANIGNAPEQEYFSDGLVDEIITALSKVPHLFVIARNSTFTYKDKPVKVQQVAEELGVRYVLEGSVRRVGDRVRITAQLIDAISGHHLWGERYDADMRDIFALQDELTMKIITALRVQLTEGEQALVYMRGTTNLEAYLKVLEARRHSRRLNPTDNLKARQLAQEAIALDPNYPYGYAQLSRARILCAKGAN
jgi:TolB-like protein